MRLHARLTGFAAGLAAFMALCRAAPGFSERWQAAVALPALRTLHALTARTASPVLEWLALAGIATAGARAAAALAGRRGRRGRRGWALALAALAAGYALLWYPAYWAVPARACPDPDAARLEALCETLIERLERRSPAGLTPEEAICQAGGVSGLAGARVKAARHPGWMRLLGISGLFSPWTGEALIDPGAPPALIPFTAVHELMHLSGIADEGAANIAAWQRCVAREGPFADSARLWALKYALSALNRVDPAACLRVMGRVNGTLQALCRPACSAPTGPAQKLCAFLGIGRATQSYDALAAWLAVREAQG